MKPKAIYNLTIRLIRFNLNQNESQIQNINSHETFKSILIIIPKEKKK